MNYSNTDEARLCAEIAAVGAAKYSELVHQLANLLNAAVDDERHCGGKDVAVKLCSFIKNAERKFAPRASVYRSHNLYMCGDDGYGQYRHTTIGIFNENGTANEVEIQWQSFHSYTDYCWDLPKAPIVSTNAESAMTSVKQSLGKLALIVQFIQLFQSAQEEIDHIEAEERRHRIIKCAAQLELLKQL